jgi:hypothetical protein
MGCGSTETALVQAAREALMCRLKPRQKLMVWLCRCKRHFDQVNGGVLDGNFVLLQSMFWVGAFSLDGLHPNPRGYALMQMLSWIYYYNLRVYFANDWDSILFCIQR